jgi:DNA topoisomerase III
MKKNIEGKEVKEFTTFDFINTKEYYDYHNNKSYKTIDGYLKTLKKPPNILFVAEKPMIARIIAHALGHTDHFSSSQGIKLYNFMIKFKGVLSNAYATSVSGHIYSKNFPEKYRNQAWNKSDPKELFKTHTINLEKTENNRKKKKDKIASTITVSEYLRIAATDIDALVLWMDCDNEGENICFEVIDVVKEYMKTNIILRARFSSLSKSDLNKAYDELQDKLYKPNQDVSLSVDARLIIDLKVGISMTRLLSNHIHKKKCVISYGPCQTPTLNFVVEAFLRNNDKRKYYTSRGTVIAGATNIILKWSKHKTLDKNQIPKKIREYSGIALFKGYALMNEGKPIEVTKPYALNTVELLRTAIRQLKIGSEEVMKIAERLYLLGLITYPRTETTMYSPSENEEAEAKLKFLGKQRIEEELKAHIKYLLATGIEIPYGGINMRDHPPITPNLLTPTEFVKAYTKLQKRDLMIYHLIVRHYIATYSKKYFYEVKKAEFVIKDELFYFKEISESKDIGFASVMPWKRKKQTKRLPYLEEGKNYNVTVQTVTINKKREEFTEADLIDKMDKHRIGTDASIPVHIMHIIKRGYAQITKENREIIPTKFGIQFIHSLQSVDKELVQPEVRAKIEELVQDIADRKQHYNSVLKQSLDIFLKKYCNVEANIKKIANSLKGIPCVQKKHTSEFLNYERRKGGRRYGRIGRRRMPSDRSESDRSYDD